MWEVGDDLFQPHNRKLWTVYRQISQSTHADKRSWVCMIHSGKSWDALTPYGEVKQICEYMNPNGHWFGGAPVIRHWRYRLWCLLPTTYTRCFNGNRKTHVSQQYVSRHSEMSVLAITFSISLAKYTDRTEEGEHAGLPELSRMSEKWDPTTVSLLDLRSNSL